jgi:hypothetical protein
MSAPLKSNDSSLPRRTTVRYRPSAELLGVPSESIREEFKQHTDGLSNRLPLPSLEAMRAGTVLSPHGLVRRYLFAGRRIGQPKAWAQKFATFVKNTPICAIGGDTEDPREDQEALANARLIAAAPEMLEALRAMLGYSERTTDTSCRCVEAEDKARAAIAKAEGR